MDIRKTLQAEHSKKQTLAIAAFIGSNPAQLKVLMDIFTGDNYRLTQRAAWPLMYVCKQNPQLLHKWIPFMLRLLKKKNLHVAVKRNVLRVMQDLPIPKSQMG